MSKQPKGDPFGAHRVLEPANTLPQAATKLDNDFSKHYDNEILCNVDILNIDAASFTVIKERAANDEKKIAEIMLDIVATQGKHQNPWTGSGGMFIGRVAKIGDALKGKIDLKVGDAIASLVSLSLTPLSIEQIKTIHPDNDQVEITGQAILFESGLWAKLPDDLPAPLSLAILDVAGAPAQVKKLVKPGDTVAVIGAAGKSGLLCCYQAKQNCGPDGMVIAIDQQATAETEDAPFIDHLIIQAADHPLQLWHCIDRLTDGKLCDVVISCVSRDNCEMGAIMLTRQHGTVYFFSMATSFTKAALGAEGIGKDIEMIIGNGYCQGHAELALNIIRHDPYLRNIYRRRYCPQE
ncbi:MAG: L-erythro-3,5-diaminohexanoate dehydrogenase [Candidatus Polarisedimenticolaceae bacterium]|nr:L-erythro-3,5-diaminohexanoate dehydrogenase [Candidatus Polarisedimenticolaceae bacterium]